VRKKTATPKRGGDAISPILKQYLEVKARHPDELLFFRMGDFYELFFEDAEKASRVLDITLTSKPMGKGHRVPLAGIPVKAAESYLARLLKAGYRVAICEQTGEGKGLMKREVVEVITPGTVFSPSLLSADRHNYLGALLEKGGTLFAALCDLTTGDFFVLEADRERALEELRKRGVAEVLFPEDMEPPEGPWSPTPYPSLYFEPDFAEDVLKRFFGVLNLEGFGLKSRERAVGAAGALLHYLKGKKEGMLGHLKGLRKLNLLSRMYLDSKTIRNLELVEKIRPEEGSTLRDVINRTKTPMGARKLTESIISPMTDKKQIISRLNRVEALVENERNLKEITEFLKGIKDLERMTARIAAGRSSPPEFVRLASSLEKLPSLRERLIGIDALRDLAEELPDLNELAENIRNVIVDDPPATADQGGFVREGVDPELDELRELALGGKSRILEIERKERKKTGIPTLKVGYNTVFGYYIEVTKAHLSKVPAHYIRKQTLTSAERFITEELKNLENLILGAEEKAVAREKEHLERLREMVRLRAGEIKKAADTVGEIDLVASFAETAIKNRYVKPIIRDDEALVIRGGRHPVVEVLQEEPFVPNDTYMDTDDNRVLIITGPNMAGKSTYLRQVALIVIMAQMGSFVPADEAEIGIVDRVFTRIGASDDLSRGVSTFMAEMIETSQILTNATGKSLIILDEVGRGTSTYDGLAIAWSVIEYINEKVGAKTLFATHYHELAELGRRLRGIKNYTVSVREWGDEVIFLRKVVPGETDRSYGIHVAKLAGLPREVIDRAKEILEIIERRNAIKATFRPDRVQLSLFGGEDPLRKRLKELKLDEITPKEALDLLYNLKEELEK